MEQSPELVTVGRPVICSQIIERAKFELFGPVGLPWLVEDQYQVSKSLTADLDICSHPGSTGVNFIVGAPATSGSSDAGGSGRISIAF